MSMMPPPPPVVPYGRPDESWLRRHRQVLLLVGAGLAAFAVFALLSRPASRRAPAAPELSLTDLSSHFDVGSVATVTVGEDELFGDFASPQFVGKVQVTRFHVTLPTGTTSDWAFTAWLLANARQANVSAAPKREESLAMTVLVPLIPWALIFAFLWFLFFRLSRQQRCTPAEPIRAVVVGPNDQRP